MYYWWTAERYCKSWSVPALLIKVEKGIDFPDRYTMFTLDDNAETTISESTFKEEVRKSSAREFEDYFAERIARLRKANLDLQLDIEKNSRNIGAFQRKVGMLSMYKTPEDFKENML